LRRHLIPLCILAGLAASPAAYAYDAPRMSCDISPDKSAVAVHVSNTSATSYQCTIWCKATVSGQHAFTPVTCSLKLGANTPDKVACSKSAPAGGTFSAIASQKSTCVPR
jgi:hypothetical protein